MLYLFAANEYALVEKAINKLLNTLLSVRTPFNYVKYDFRSTPFASIAEDALTYSFDSDTRVFVIDHTTTVTSSNEKSVNKELSDSDIAVLSTLSGEAHLIFVARSSKVNPKNNLYQFIDKNGKITIEKDVDQNDWRKFVYAFFDRNNLAIDSDAANELIKRVSDLSSFLNEAEKLALYGEKVTLSLVEELVTPLLEEKGFNLVNAFIEGNRAAALKIYEDFKVQNQEPTVFIAMVANQFRLYAQIFVLHELGKTNDEIASTLKVHPYRVKLAMDQRRKTSLDQVFNILLALSDLDYKIKSGQIDRFYGFELFLLNY